jgi:hypothetical protein
MNEIHYPSQWTHSEAEWNADAGRRIGGRGHMVTVDEFSHLVSGIYAAAVTPQHWATATREICRALDGTSGGLATANGAMWSIQNSALPAAAVESYGEYYGRLDRVLDALEKGPVGAVRTGTELIPLVRKYRMPLPANAPPFAAAGRSPALGPRVSGPMSFTCYPPTAIMPMSHSGSRWPWF